MAGKRKADYLVTIFKVLGVLCILAWFAEVEVDVMHPSSSRSVSHRVGVVGL